MTAPTFPRTVPISCRRGYAWPYQSGLGVIPIVGRLNEKASCRVATTANITLSGTQTIDDIEVEVDDRVLVKDQSSALANGVYVVASGSWSRSSDLNASTEMLWGVKVKIREGTTNADTAWALTTVTAITLGATSLSWTSVDLTATTLPVVISDASITFSGEVNLSESYDSTTLIGMTVAKYDSTNGLMSFGVTDTETQALVVGRTYWYSVLGVGPWSNFETAILQQGPMFVEA